MSLAVQSRPVAVVALPARLMDGYRQDVRIAEVDLPRRLSERRRACPAAEHVRGKPWQALTRLYKNRQHT
jgi:hypothetical protein